MAKLGGFGGRVLAEIWERGFKETLTAYVASVAGFLQSMTLLRTVLEEAEVGDSEILKKIFVCVILFYSSVSSVHSLLWKLTPAMAK